MCKKQYFFVYFAIDGEVVKTETVLCVEVAKAMVNIHKGLGVVTGHNHDAWYYDEWEAQRDNAVRNKIVNCN